MKQIRRPFRKGLHRSGLLIRGTASKSHWSGRTCLGRNITSVFRTHGLRSIRHVRIALDFRALTQNEVGYSFKKKRLFEYKEVIRSQTRLYCLPLRKIYTTACDALQYFSISRFRFRRLSTYFPEIVSRFTD